MQLTEIKEYKGTIEILSGLHIGSGDAGIRIGGADSTVVKNARTGKPYIPGSSLKGKIRSLLELKTPDVKEGPLGVNDYKKGTEDTKLIIKLFGAGADNSDNCKDIGPTRIIFSDCQMIDNHDDSAIYEVKSENSINRITGTADNPRFIERVVAGTKFNFTISIRVFDIDNDGSDLENKLLEGISLLEKDALGASGSRGYGKIKFNFDDASIQNKLDKLNQ